MKEEDIEVRKVDMAITITITVWLLIGSLTSAYAVYEDGIDVEDIFYLPIAIAIGPVFTATVAHEFIKRYHPNILSNWRTILKKRLVLPRSERK